LGNGHGELGRDLFPIANLSEGGMGRIVLAQQASLAREVVIKTLRNAAEPGDASALVREGKVTGKLEHPGIVPVHALGVDQDRSPVLVMKRVEGVTWRTLLSDPTHAAWSTLAQDVDDRLEANLDILIAVCRALELAHSRGVIHRDIKPENVMVGA